MDTKIKFTAVSRFSINECMWVLCGDIIKINKREIHTWEKERETERDRHRERGRQREGVRL